MLAMRAIGAIMRVLGLVFNILLLVGAGALTVLSSYGTTFVWMRQRYNEGLYEFLVALFNALKDFDLGREETDQVLKYMSSILLSVKEGNPSSGIDGIIAELASYLGGAAGERAKTFLKAQKFTTKYVD